MAGDAGTEIGRISIKVTPDVKGFRRATENAVNSQIAGVEGEAKINPGTKGFREKVKAATSNLPDAKVKIKAEAAPFDRTLAKMQKNMAMLDLGWEKKMGKGLANLSFNYQWDRKVQAFLKENIRLREAEAAAAEKVRLAEAKTAAKLNLAAAAHRAEYAAFKRTGDFEKATKDFWDSYRRMGDLEVKLKIIEDSTRWNPHMLRRRIQSFFTLNPVKLPVEFDEKGLRKTVDKLPKPPDLMPNFGSGINLSGYAAILGAITLVAAPLLGLITTALLSLPGLISLVATPIAAITLGLDGFKKAAESIKGPFDALRASMSKAVESQFTPMFDTLKNLFPALERSMPNVSQGLADMGKSIANFVTGDVGMARIERTINNIGDSLSKASPGLTDFVDGFTLLAEQFSLKLPDLMDWFNQQGANFKNWIQELTDTGDLSAAFDTLGQVLDEILSTMGELAKSGMEFVSDPGAVDGFVAALEDLLGVLESVADVSAKLGPVWDGLGVIFDGAMMFVNPGQAVQDMGNRLKDMVGSPQDAEQVGKELASAMRNGLSNGLDAGAKIGTEVFDLSGVAPAVKAQLDQIKQDIGVTAEEQKQALKSAFTPGAVDGAIKNQLETQVRSAVEGAQAALASMGPDLQAALDQGTMPLMGLADKIGNIVGPAFDSVRQASTGAFALMVLSIGAQANNVANAVSGAFDRIPAEVGQALSGIPDSIRGAFDGLATVVVGAWAPVVQTVITGSQQILVAVSSNLTQLPMIVTQLFSAMTASITGQMALAVQAVAAGCGQMVATANSFAGAMFASGASIGASFASGMRSMQGVVSQAASDLVGAARLLFPNSPAKEGPFSGSGWVDKSGESVGDAFASGMQSSMSGVVDTARQLMQAVKDVFGDASGLTLNFNLGGATQGFAGLQSQLGNISTLGKDFQTSMVNTANPTKQLDASSKQQVEDLTQQLALLEQRRKELELLKINDPKSEAIKGELEQIRQQKLSLGLEKDRLNYAMKYEGAVSSTNDQYAEQIKGMQKLPLDFAMATGQQAMQDFGISGNGMLSNLANIGLDYGSKFIFNVSNIDEAMTAKDREVSRQGMGIL